ncbi:MAG: hypothetical protein LBB43_03050 [Spirochaetaceae bacterium]|jgi:hypothetical protein|nr:hypothetical protein [Spirochaetaceae bacterium]
MKRTFLHSSALIFHPSFLIFCCFFSIITFIEAQESSLFTGTIPAFVHTPGYGEAFRYPQDTAIGSFGTKSFPKVPSALYSEAQKILGALLNANPDEPALTPLKERDNGSSLDDLYTTIKSLGARNFRIGEGREEADGSFSFVFRFMSADRSVTGELYCIMVDEQWRLDDIVLDDVQEIVPEDPLSFNKERYSGISNR